MGFVGPGQGGMVKDSGVEPISAATSRDTLAYKSTKEKISCGDMRRGQSLVVWPSAKAARPPAPWTSISWVGPTCRGSHSGYRPL